MALITFSDLLPSGEDLQNAALNSTSGDPAGDSIGTHKGRNPHRRDTMGISKQMIHDHALAGDIHWFNGFADRLWANPHKLSRSLRTLIPKDVTNPQKGVRPIDDPSEIKRLLALHVRKILQPVGEQMMHSGQYGGRPSWAVTPLCKRPGATVLDHIAQGIHRAIWAGFPYCLAIDLKDAYGLIPHKAAIQEFRGLGLDEEAARWLWRLIRIDAVDVETRRIRYRRKTWGIEQGNPLSSTVMNLVLAPIMKAVEDNLGVKAYSYLDDLYIMTKTDEDAYEAFKLFKQEATCRGFTNVRRLWVPGDPLDAKLSQIIDTTQEPVTVLKSYMVDGLGTSLHPVKVKELKDEGELTRKVSLKELRRISNCQSLTKGASRMRTPEILHMKRNLEPQDPSDSVSAAYTMGDYMDYLERSFLYIPIQGEDEVSWTSGSIHIGADAPYYSIVGEDGNLGYFTIGNLEGCEDSISYPYRDSTDYGTKELSLHDSTTLFFYEGFHSQFRQGDQAGGTFKQEGSPATEGGNTLDRGQTEAADQSAHLSAISEEGRRIALNRRSCGTLYKGRILDLRGLEGVLGSNDDLNVCQLVNRLIKMVREKRRATIVIDPTAEWTAEPGLLGNHRDQVYKRTSYECQPDGSAWITLLHKRTPEPRGPHKPVNIPPAELIIRSIRCSNHGLYLYEVNSTRNGERHREVISTNTPNEAAGALRAIRMALQNHYASTVAVQISGLAGVSGLLADPDVAPAHVVLGAELKQLRSLYRWEMGKIENYITGDIYRCL